MRRGKWADRSVIRGSGRGTGVAEIRTEPALGFFHGPALASRVILHLVASDPSDLEVARTGMREIPAAYRGRWHHRVMLGQPDPGARLGVQHLPKHVFLRVIRAGRVAGRGPDAAIILG